MMTGPDRRIATLDDARSRRSAEKRAAVEDAIMRLRDSKQAVTFVAVAREAKVSRQYLYNNFADEIGEERVETRAGIEVIDGKKIPLRTPEEYRHIEAALRNKIERLEAELKEARAEKAKSDRTAERERGKAEHWRQNYTAVLARVSPGQTPTPPPSSDD
jgi:AcrR family transcriptional regulator